MNLVASVMVKNELGRYLQACIGSLREFCELVVVLDDGSTDRTGEWLNDNADDRMVVKHIDPEDGFFAGHEGRRRQRLLDLTIEQRPTHVLAIDADEFVAKGTAVHAFCQQTDFPVGKLMMEEVWTMAPDRLGIRIDGGWRPHPVPIVYRVDTYDPDFWKINDRALSCGREPTAIRSIRGGGTIGTEVLHFGWANPDTRLERYQRYVAADGGRFHSRRHLDSIMWTNRKVQLYERKWPRGLSLGADGVVTYLAP
jgi:hypothetical protein